MAIIAESGRNAVAASVKSRQIHMAWGTGDPLWDSSPEPEDVGATALLKLSKVQHPRQYMKKLSKNWKQRLLKSYSSWAIIANILIALSISGLSVLGAISNVLAIPLLVGLAIAFGVVGLLGRVIDQGLDDVRQDCKGEVEDDSK